MHKNPTDKLWNAILGELQLRISPANFSTWVKPLRVIHSEENMWTLGVQNGFMKNRIETRYQDLIEKIATKHTESEIRVRCKIHIPENTSMPTDGLFQTKDSPKKNNVILENKTKPLDAILPPGHNFIERQPSPREIRLNPRFTFESFVIGTHNKMAHAAALAVADSPGMAYNPLFLYGGVGLGKTHLMHAIAKHALIHSSASSVLYVTSEQFTNELISSIRSNDTNAFRKKYRDVDMLLIDDIQFIAGKESTQEEFFHTFNALHSIGKQIILSSDRPPIEIGSLEDRLRSRFGAGLIADIQKPTYETRIAILEKKLSEKGIIMASDVVETIARIVSSNIRDLEGSLNKIITHGKIYGTGYTPELVQHILRAYQEEDPIQNLTPKEIIENTMAYFQIPKKMFQSKSRKREVVLARQVAMYLMREIGKNSLNQIGLEFGGKDHTTVLHACKKIENLLHTDESFERHLQNIKNAL